MKGRRCGKDESSAASFNACQRMQLIIQSCKFLMHSKTIIQKQNVGTLIMRIQTNKKNWYKALTSGQSELQSTIRFVT
jgi:hypothetical protein